MTELRPVQGYVVAPEAAEEVVAPPYDALTPEERATHVEAHPRSFLSVLPEAEHTAEPALGQARERLEGLVADGAFEAQARPFVAVYRLTEGSHVQTGLVAELPVSELRAGRVRPHEHTRPERVAEIVRFIEEVGVTSSPVSLAFRGGAALRAAIAAATHDAPHVTVTDRGVRQELWVVDDTSLTSAADELTELYITDGHHRFAAALAYAEDHDGDGAAGLLTVLFPADELRLVDYHRIVSEPELGVAEVAAVLADAGWEVVPLAEPEDPPAPRHVLLAGGVSCYRLVMPPHDRDGSDPAGGLDAARLQDEVLGAILGVDDPRNHPGIRFVPGDRGAAALAAEVAGTSGIGFALHPPRMADLIAVADAGTVMPPKSTYFTPKVRSGLLLRFHH